MNNKCCFCLELIIDESTELPCKHIFHKKCLNDYELFKYNNYNKNNMR